MFDESPPTNTLSVNVGALSALAVMYVIFAAQVIATRDADLRVVVLPIISGTNTTLSVRVPEAAMLTLL